MRDPLGCGILVSASAGLCRILYQVLALPKPPRPLLPLTCPDIPCALTQCHLGLSSLLACLMLTRVFL